MRGLLLGVVIAAFAVVPSVARAADEPLCKLGGDGSWQSRLNPYLGAVPAGQTGVRPRLDDAARSALGAQFAGFWLDNIREGVGIAMAPGPLDLATATQRVHDAVAALFGSADMAYLDSVIQLSAVPYSEADLLATQAALGGVVAEHRDLFVGYGITCFGSDAFRVAVFVPEAETPELRARVEPLLAPFGDQVWARYGTGWPMPTVGSVGRIPESDVTAPAPAPVRVRDHVTLAASSRCVHGRKLTVKAAKTVRSVKVNNLTVKPGQRATLKLSRRINKVTITVTLKDGRTATQQLTYRRC